MNNRWVVLSSGILIQLILGGIYAWSIFVPELINSRGLTAGQCGLIFGLLITSFTLSMIMGGRVLTEKGPRFTSCIGSVLFGAGFILASFSGGDCLSLILTISLITGAGIGFCYVCPISAGMQWFPDKKGLITGITVAGFGGGAIALSSVARHFLSSGMDVMELFRWMGIIQGIILFLSSIFLSVPGGADNKQVKNSGCSEVFTLPFILCVTGLFCGTFSGLIIVGNLTPIILKAGGTGDLAVQAVSIFAVGNALGRIAWGYLFDKISYYAIPFSLGSFAVFILPLTIPLPFWLLMICACMLGVGFGSNFVVYASAISRYFGVEAFPRIYPLCFLIYGLAGITGPGFGGHVADITGSYTMALYLCAFMLFAAVIFTGAKVKSFTKK